MTTAIRPRRSAGYGAYTSGANALAMPDTLETPGRLETPDTVDSPVRPLGPKPKQPTRKATAARPRRAPWVSDVTAPTPEAPLPIALPRAPFLILMVGLVVVGVLGVLVLNTKINENSFRLSDLKATQAALDLQEQQLSRSLADLESPGNLRAAATRLGLVPAGTPAFINLPDGRVVGVPQPAAGR